MIVFFILLIFYNTTLVTTGMQVFLRIPLVSYLGNSLYALKCGDLESVLSGLLLLGLASGLGLFCFAMLPKKD